MPQIPLKREVVWTGPALAEFTKDGNVYRVMDANHLVVCDLDGYEKYQTTLETCTCPAGAFNKLCKHRKALAEWP